MSAKSSATTLPGNDPLHFGALLREFREERQLSQTELSQKIKRSPSFISLLESNTRRPTPELIAEIAIVLPLNDDQKHRLLAAAGYTLNGLEATVDHILQSIDAGRGIDPVEHAIIRQEYLDVTRGWEALQTGIATFDAGELVKAQGILSELAGHEEHPSSLKILIYLRYTVVLLRLGQLTEAEKWIGRAHYLVQPYVLQRDTMTALEADVKVVQGIVVMRRGRYAEAKTYIEQGVGMYQKMLVNPDTRPLAHFGLGKSYKRLAEVALLQGEPSEAITHCASAELYLKSLQSPQSEPWRRRLQELNAWAYTELHHFTKAIELRQENAVAHRKHHDAYDLAKNALYLADDYRRRLEEEITHSIPQMPLAGIERRSVLRDLFMREPWMSLDVTTAMTHYQHALDGLTQMGDQLLLGRCYRGMAIMLRMKSAEEDTSTDYHRAGEMLQQALLIERTTGQARRVPTVYESMAELEWDWGNLRGACDYYESAKRAIDGNVFTDKALDRLLRRLEAALQRLLADPALQSYRARRSVPELHTSSVQWNKIIRSLEQRLNNYFTAHGTVPNAAFEYDVGWLNTIITVERSHGPRLLAQNRLSSALSRYMNGVYLRDDVGTATILHQERCRILENAVEGTDIYQDLCCRATVERGLESQDFERRLVVEQIRTANQYTSATATHYQLHTCMIPLPFNFEVKSDFVLLEIPYKEARRFLTTVPNGTIDDTLCYRIEDAALSHQFTEIFGQLVSEGQAMAPNTTHDWLQSLIVETDERIIA